MIEVSTHSKYITEKDLLEWENSLKGDNKVKRLINKSVSSSLSSGTSNALR